MSDPANDQALALRRESLSHDEIGTALLIMAGFIAVLGGAWAYVKFHTPLFKATFLGFDMADIFFLTMATNLLPWAIKIAPLRRVAFRIRFILTGQ